ncbi:polysaccharide deacetylase family protein [Echinicola strongylocentroti]|uniref:Polysaccharide deacetylase family protein n=1 Tax=Echinicola strongylocentroti TaxID=1795355 RepID=A0A2Z4ISC8_9BACT|nr:polysaccharide deacetylase family protein [Echinicola strongylocentroti]AWW33213.1 polysaccharide deacetylase family protein [Echinicola strongylocentroti]
METSVLFTTAARAIVLTLCWLLSLEVAGQQGNGQVISHGAVIRGDTTKRQLALVFTGHQFADGGTAILNALEEEQVKASFFFTGDFYRNNAFGPLIEDIKQRGHYLGAHSDKHLLYCDWEQRDRLLVSKQDFAEDLKNNYREMAQFGIEKEDARFYLPPYEWYNDSISKWTAEMGLQVVDFTPGTRSNADYTSPEMENYVSSEAILRSIMEQETSKGMNGFMLLMHIGVSPKRTDKFYDKLCLLISTLRQRGYRLVTVDELLCLQN